MRFFILWVIITLCYGCGVYLEYPPVGNNIQWKRIQYNDTAVYRLAKKKAVIDSVVNVVTQEVFYSEDKRSFKLPGSHLEPGINEVIFDFYYKGKKKRSYESLYMVSDFEPYQLELDNYFILQHDEEAFTQGLFYWNEYLFESTGLIGQSSIRIINPDDGALIQKVQLDSTIFAEGITALDNQLHVLTWKDGLVYRFDEGLKQISMHPYRQEGWGLTSFNEKLLASDGSHKLFFLSNSYKPDSVINVFNHRGPVHYINELEHINGQIWANVLGDDKIIVINPSNGKIEVEIDVSKCIDRQRYTEAGVLNGIAFDSKNELVYLTGKNWPYLIVCRLMSFDKSNK